MILKLSLFDNKRDTKPKQVTHTWAQLCERLARPFIRAEKDGPLFSPASFNPPQRLNANVTELSLLVLDCDHDTTLEALIEPLRELKCAFAIYSTHSHMRATDSNPRAEPRFRAVVPLFVPIPAASFPALWCWARWIKGIVADEQAKDLSRMFYTPAKASADAPYQYYVQDGEFLNWRKLDLSEYAPLEKSEAQGDHAQANGCATRTFVFHEDRHAELVRRIIARGKLNPRGHYDARCLAHNGRGTTGLCYFPDTNAIKCNDGCDYFSLLRAEGLPDGHLPSKASWKLGTQIAQPEQWDLPAAFYEFDLPNFPVESLPDWQRAFVEGLARETQTPVDLPAMLVLPVTAGAVAGKVRVQVRPGWVEPLNLYTVTAMPPANRKSAVFKATCEPLEEVERALVEEKRDDIAQAASKYRVLEERLRRLERQAAKIEDPIDRATKHDEAVSLAQELAKLKVPVVPRLIAADATPEALASLLVEHGGRMCLFSPEGDLFDMLAGRYTNGAPNFDVILKGHCGDALRVDRRGRSEHVANPALTIGLTVQPDVIRGLVDKPGFRGRGLLGRFLYSMPKSTVGRRQIDPAPLATNVRQTYKTNIKVLAQIEPPTDCEGLPVPRMLYLSAEASALLKNFEWELEPKLADDGELGMMSDWAGKLPGAVVRIVSNLHMAENVQHFELWESFELWPQYVSGETMQRAISIGRYLIPHAKAAFAEMGADPQIENARILLVWIKKTGQLSFTKRDAHQNHRGRFKKVTDIEPALDLLESHGYIRTRTDDTARRPGRKASQIFDVNPFLYSASLNSYNTQFPAPGDNSEHCEDSENESGTDGNAENDMPGVFAKQDGADGPADVRVNENAVGIPFDETYFERAAIIEHDGGLPREESERLARRARLI